MLAATLAASAASIGTSTGNARALSSPPPATWSRYVTTTNLYTPGCNQGKWSDTNHVNDIVVILDFGKMYYQNGSYGAVDWGVGFRTTTQIAATAETFLQGFWDCTKLNSPSNVNVAIGTNNCTTDPNCVYSNTTYAGGQAWGNMVKSVNSWVVSKRYSAQEYATGANDMEVDWESAANTRNWADGYTNVSNYPYYDYGDAAGCPTSGQTSANRNCATPHETWTQNDLYYLVWQEAVGWPLPEIYLNDNTQSKQWQQITLYGYLAHSGNRIEFTTGLSQSQACADVGDPCTGKNLSPSGSFNSLYNTLNADSRTAPNPTSSYEFRWATTMAWNNSQ